MGRLAGARSLSVWRVGGKGPLAPFPTALFYEVESISAYPFPTAPSERAYAKLKNAVGNPSEDTLTTAGPFRSTPISARPL